ncbi:MAG: hypothetical protein AAFV53_06000 [Myxococcota bacterium]
MRPHDPNARKQSLNTSRARMYLKAYLAWTTGFPLNGNWIQLSEPGSDLPSGPIEMTRDRLSDSQRYFYKLRDRFPRALPRVVGDVDAWAEGVDDILDAAKGVVHDGAAWPAHRFDVLSRAARNEAKALARAPGLRPLIEGMSWVVRQDPKQMSAGLDWAAPRTQPLGVVIDRFGVFAAMQLWRMATQDQVRRVDPLMGWLSHPGLGQCPTLGLIEYLEAWMVRANFAYDGAATLKPAPSRPGPIQPETFHQFLEAVYPLPTSPRRQALEVLAMMLPTAAVDEWVARWAAVDSVIPRLASLCLAPRAKRRRDPRISEIRATIKGMIQAGEPRGRCPGVSVPTAVRLCQSRHQGVLKRLLKVIRRLPLDMREVMVSHWADAIDDEPDLVRIEAEHMARLSFDTPGWDWIWEPLLRQWPRNQGQLLGMLGWFIDEPKERFRAFLQAAERLAGEGGTPAARGRLASLSFECQDVDRLVTAIRLTQPYVEQGWFHEDSLTLVLLVAEHPKLTTFLDQVLPRRHDLDPEDILVATRGLMDTTDWFDRAFDDGQLAQLATMGSLLRSLKRSRFDPPSLLVYVHDVDVSVYPELLRPALLRLVAASPKPRKAIASALGKDLPDPEALRRELTAITQRIADGAENPGLVQRRDNLRERIANPRPLSPARMVALNLRIHHAATQASMNAWIEDAEQLLRTALLERISDAAAERLLAARNHALFSSLLGLDANVQAVAWRALDADARWPLDDPRNTQFLDQMTAMGIKMAPWTSPRRRAVVSDNDRALTLSFAESVEDIMWMGEHFQTCLGFGRFNFFSTISNAVDVNKRVLYVSDENDSVVGRCLMALTDSGALLTFHPYSHDAEAGMERLVREWVTALATEMNTIVASQGPVSSLVAPEWYDDGPRDLVESFPKLPALEASLPALDAADFMAQLADALEPMGVTELTLPLVLGMQNLTAAQTQALMPHIRSARYLSDEQLWRVIHRIGSAAPEQARQLIRRRDLASSALRMGSTLWHHVPEELLTFARLEPIPAHRFFRALIKDGLEDALVYCGLGLCLEELYRRSAAREAYRTAIRLNKRLPLPRERLKALDAISS